MYFLSKPKPDEIRTFLFSQKNQPFSYAHVGASRGNLPVGYTVDKNRVRLGEGAECYARAVGAVRQWKMFEMPWVELCWPDAPIQEGTTVAVLVQHLRFWSLNASRIVYLIDEDGRDKRFGFAYGTLMQHAERGEERFSVEFHADDQSVWYDLCAFSKPSLLARLGYPFARALQKRFAADSKRSMQKAAAEQTA